MILKIMLEWIWAFVQFAFGIGLVTFGQPSTMITLPGQSGVSFAYSVIGIVLVVFGTLISCNALLNILDLTRGILFRNEKE